MLGYFLPWLQLKREAGEIKQGKYFENKSFTLNFEGESKTKSKSAYYGEVDSEG